VLDERCADVDARVEEHGEDSLMQARFANGLRDDETGEFPGARMRGMRFDHNGTAGSERRGCISASYGKGQREIAGSKDRNGTECAQHGADVRARQRLAVGKSRVDTGLNP
jgi:hypothetical protein